MKALRLLIISASIAGIGWVSYWHGQHDGFKAARAVYSQGIWLTDNHIYSFLPESHCYTPGEAHNADTPPCVVVDE